MFDDLPRWAEGRILSVAEAEAGFVVPNQPRLLKLVWTNGCFEIIHPSHCQLFRKAKQLGHVLIVGVNSDESVRKLKGPGRPVINARDRALVVLSMVGVDLVVIFDEDEPSEPIRRIKPDIVVKGSAGGYVLEEMPEWPVVQSYGGRVVSVDTWEGYSTSAVIDRIRRMGNASTEQQ